MIKLYRKNGAVGYDDGTISFYDDSSRIAINKISNTSVQIVIFRKSGDFYPNPGAVITDISNIYDGNGVQYGTTYEDLVPLFDLGNDVSIQDQHTQSVLVKFNKVHASTTLTVLAVVDAYTITVDDDTDIVAGNYIILYSAGDKRFSLFTAIDVTTNVITLDTPIDFAYPIGTFVDSATTNMNVNGSSTPVVFGVRGTTIAQDAVPIEFDVTRILFKCTTTNTVDLSKFADIGGGLTRGLVLRKRDGQYFNIFNVKTNGDIAGICLDWIPYAASNPVEGQNGFTARLTFGGQDKIGVVQRLGAGEDLECIVQDAQQTITSLEITAEGHIVSRI